MNYAVSTVSVKTDETDKILPEVLSVAKENQEGRGNQNLPSGKFNFTERDGAVYRLRQKLSKAIR